MSSSINTANAFAVYYSDKTLCEYYPVNVAYGVNDSGDAYVSFVSGSFFNSLTAFLPLSGYMLLSNSGDVPFTFSLPGSSYNKPQSYTIRKFLTITDYNGESKVVINNSSLSSNILAAYCVDNTGSYYSYISGLGFLNSLTSFEPGSGYILFSTNLPYNFYAASTPTPTTSPTPTPSVTVSVSRSPTPTPTPTITNTPSISPSITPSVTIGATPSPTPTLTPTKTPTRTPTLTPSITPSITPTITITPTQALLLNQYYVIGNNSSGQFGFGNTSNISILTKINQGGFTKLVAGDNHIIALSGSKMFAAGDNSYGQLGASSFNNTETSFIPVTGNWDDIVATRYQTFALSANTGGIWFGAGNNQYGTIGVGSINSNLRTFNRIPGTYEKIVCGDAHTFAYSANKWYGAGYNFYGQLGLGYFSNVFPNYGVANFTPILGNFDDIKCGNNFTYAKSAATNKWLSTGLNNLYQLGLNDNINRNSFNLVGEFDVVYPGHFNAFARDLLGTWSCVGYNNNYQLGQTYSTNITSFTSLPGIYNIIYSAVSTNSYAVNGRSIFVCGNNTNSQLIVSGSPVIGFTDIGTQWDDIQYGSSFTVLKINGLVPLTPTPTPTITPTRSTPTPTPTPSPTTQLVLFVTYQ